MPDVLNFPDHARAISPDRLAAARVALLLSRTDVARALDVTSTTIGNYETGVRRPDMAVLLRLAALLRQPVSYFLRAAHEPRKAVRFFRSVGPKSNRLNMALDARIGWLFDFVSMLEARGLRLPAANLPEFDLDLSDAGYSPDQIEFVATSVRRHWGLGDGPINNVVALLESNGVIVSRFRMPSVSIDAFSSWLGARPYVLLGSDKSSAVRSRFDAAHELGHLVLHRSITAEDLEAPAVRKRIESEANYFAGAFLLPKPSLLREFYSTRATHVKGLKARWLVSMQAIVHRAMTLGAIDESQFVAFRIQLLKRKQLSSEPLDDAIPFELPGLLFSAWNKLIDAGRLPRADASETLGYSFDVLEDHVGRPIERGALRSPDISIGRI